MTVLTVFTLMQMPGPRDIVIYWLGPRAFSVVQKPWGWAHISVQKPRGARGDGNRLIWYLHYCSPLSRSDYIFFTAQPMKSKGVHLFLLKTCYDCSSTGKRMCFWTFMDINPKSHYLIAFNLLNPLLYVYLHALNVEFFFCLPGMQRGIHWQISIQSHII